MPNPSLAYIYMGAIYMFSAFIRLLLCILIFAYMCGYITSCYPTSEQAHNLCNTTTIAIKHNTK